MYINSKEKFNNSLISSKTQSDLIMKRRIESANFTKIIKNRIFKGYNKIKFIKSKDFNLKHFLSQNPEEKYLLSSEEYNIYYENKFLRKFKTDTKNVSSLLTNSIINTRGKNRKTFKNKSVSFDSKFDLESNYSTTKRIKRSHLNNLENNKSNCNINNSREVFKNKREEKAFSKYPFVFFDKMPDNVNNPKNLRNYPYYNPKYKQKNRNQQSFLFTISHHKEKKIKNLYRCQSARTIHKNYNRGQSLNSSFNNKDNYNFISFSYSTKKENSLVLKKFITSIKNAKLKRSFKKKNYFNFFK